ncbi:hypothetical protein M6I34_06120 [Burkholderiaceae bacterium FT117]|uniref:hypothetical protein n=1 Tax=Zeimonas sediminis TaxID=2944268 RepID=UPI00234312B1|nr:hypothetical protein [Zeimonas sediminis]MCM5570077.1 hypothetical protein [Zeimonas sediminis]
MHVRPVPDLPIRQGAERRPARLFRAVASLLLGGLAAGCAQFIVPVPPPPDPPGEFAELTLPIIALGDTQEHETTGFPLHDNDGAVDSYVEVAQRPPEQPLFGRRILEWALAAHPGEPVIHLGDVLDMSCRSELARIGAVFEHAGQAAALLPGNHDGLMFGIFNQPLAAALTDGGSRAWYRGCVRGARQGDPGQRLDPKEVAVDKRGFVTAYLETLARSRAPGLSAPGPSGEVRVSWRNPDPEAYLQAIEAKLLDERFYANSFVVQKLRLPAAPGATRRVTMIGFDTNQVDVLVGTLDTLRSISPGHIGHVRADQLEAIAPWLDEARRAGDIVVLAGHHNWNQLSFGSQFRITALVSDLDHPLVYLSAHTHRGFWATHRIGERSLLELNVSSLSDWPIAYRRVSFALDEKAKRLKVRAEIMPNDGGGVQSDVDILRAWESQVCAASGYSAFVAELESLHVVKAQRDARGTLLEWLFEGLGEWCRPCQQALYESGMRYQDALLETAYQLHADFSDRLPEVAAMRVPSTCGTQSLPACIVGLRSETPRDLEGTIELFRRKAGLVDALNHQFDGLKDPRVRAYMACRAVVAARTDYDLTPDSRRVGRGEENRRRMDFFRIEATVGMQ